MISKHAPHIAGEGIGHAFAGIGGGDTIPISDERLHAQGDTEKKASGSGKKADDAPGKGLGHTPESDTTAGTSAKPQTASNGNGVTKGEEPASGSSGGDSGIAPSNANGTGQPSSAGSGSELPPGNGSGAGSGTGQGIGSGEGAGSGTGSGSSSGSGSGAVATGTASGSGTGGVITAPGQGSGSGVTYSDIIVGMKNANEPRQCPKRKALEQARLASKGNVKYRKRSKKGNRKPDADCGCDDDTTPQSLNRDRKK